MKLISAVIGTKDSEGDIYLAQIFIEEEGYEAARKIICGKGMVGMEKIIPEKE